MINFQDAMKEFVSRLFMKQESASRDVLGLYPERAHIKALPERRFLKATRVMLIWSILGLAITIVLATCILILVPMKRVTPRFFYIDKEVNQLKDVQRRTVVQTPDQIMLESNISRFIRLRYTIVPDVDEMTKIRWALPSQNTNQDISELYARAVPLVQTQMMAEREKYLHGLTSIQLVQEVLIQRLDNNPYTKTWTVDFYVLSQARSYSASVVVSKWRAFVKAQYVSTSLLGKGVPSKNPLGFRVTAYYAGLSTDPEHLAETMDPSLGAEESMALAIRIVKERIRNAFAFEGERDA